jgi:dTDP-4-dehydrorhamnose 3,5-epimerase
VIFNETPLTGAFLLEPEPLIDERGSFMRLWCQREFQQRGLEGRLVQCSVSYNRLAGTLRGMHYQVEPHAEVKIVRCTRGSVFDVIIDLRPESPTFTRHFAIVLSATSRTMLYIPRGFAHGFQTLDDDTEVTYQMSAFYESSAARGVRWNDPAFGIEWPRAHTRIMNERDISYPDFVPAGRTLA